MSNKKKLSVVVNKVLDRALKDFSDCFVPDEKEGCLLYLRDIDPMSPFYFSIIKEVHERPGHLIHIAAHPFSDNSNVGRTGQVSVNGLEKSITEWLRRVQYYNEPSLVNDPVINAFENEFCSYVRFASEEDANTPLTFDQQEVIIGLLNEIIEKIDDIKDESNERDIRGIKEDSEKLKGGLSSSSQNAFLRGFSRIVARARKVGPQAAVVVLREFVKSMSGEAGKRAFNFVLNYIGDAFQAFKLIGKG
ncbi:MAG TPA: hypothetical protein PKD45_00435 [Flavobacteriales bacterium]|nr:hypothetical protein [Flavobacteriales bacterium]